MPSPRCVERHASSRNDYSYDQSNFMKKIISTTVIALGLLPFNHALATEYPCKDLDDTLAQQNEWISPSSKDIYIFTRNKPLEGSYLFKNKEDGNFRHSYQIKEVELIDLEKNLRHACRLTMIYESGDCKGDADNYYLEKIGKSIKFSETIRATQGYWTASEGDLVGACERRDKSSWHISPFP